MFLRTIKICVSCFSCDMLCMSLAMGVKIRCLLRFFSIEDVYCYFLCLFNLSKIITEYKIFIRVVRQKHMLLEMGMAYVKVISQHLSGGMACNHNEP